MPGMKLGLANIVVLLALYSMGAKSALAVNFVRIVLVSVLFGNGVSFWYSLAGGLLSGVVMIALGWYLLVLWFTGLVSGVVIGLLRAGCAAGWSPHCGREQGMKKRFIAVLCLGAALLSGCGAEPSSASADVFAMDTYMTVTTYGERCEDALDAAVAEIERLDALLRVGNADSEVSRINASGSGNLSADTQVMVERALDIWRTTGGAFDITVYPIMQA